MVRSIDDGLAMVEAICLLPGNLTALRRYEARIRTSGLAQAIIAHDSAFIYGWLMEAFSFQGISDANALDCIEAHANADWMEIDNHLQANPPGCPKLMTFDAYKDCGYRKVAQTCNVPELIGTCVVPQLPLRKGDHNQLALGLFLFIRDVCKGDLVKFIDMIIAEVRLCDSDQFEREGRLGLVTAFKPIFGIGPKLIAMSLASILIAGGRLRPTWVKVGRSMIVIDSLVRMNNVLKAHSLPPIRFPRGPEVWGRDEALEAEAEPWQATGEQRHRAAGDVFALVLRGFFSAGVLFSGLSHMPVETAQ